LIKPEMKINNTDDVLSLVTDIRNKKQEHFITITLVHDNFSKTHLYN